MTLIGLFESLRVDMNVADKLISGIAQIAEQHRPSVVSIGNYDGVHLGHQHVVKTLLQKSAELNVPSTVITFEPLAKEFFNSASVQRLTSLEQRAELLSALGVDQIVAINFTQEFADYSPEKFTQDVLLDGLGVKYLCVGDDFRFGKDRAGDFDFLQKVGHQKNFKVESHATFELAGERVSSGRVREALIASDFELTEQLLGRPYSIKGVITEGQQIGRTIQFPTANIVLDDYLMAVQGVFAVRCSLNKKEGLLEGVANIGRRPTVDGKQNRLEVHIFDFNKDIYAQTLDVQLVSKIRDEKKFADVDQLQKQISIDVDTARKIFRKVK